MLPMIIYYRLSPVISKVAMSYSVDQTVPKLFSSWVIWARLKVKSLPGLHSGHQVQEALKKEQLFSRPLKSSLRRPRHSRVTYTLLPWWCTRCCIQTLASLGKKSFRVEACLRLRLESWMQSLWGRALPECKDIIHRNHGNVLGSTTGRKTWSISFESTPLPVNGNAVLAIHVWIVVHFDSLTKRRRSPANYSNSLSRYPASWRWRAPLNWEKYLNRCFHGAVIAFRGTC